MREVSTPSAEESKSAKQVEGKCETEQKEWTRIYKTSIYMKDYISDVPPPLHIAMGA